jgi:hypothetical protein
MAIHHDVAAAVDALLRGRPNQPEVRYLDENGKVRIEKATETTVPPRSEMSGPGRLRRRSSEPTQAYPVSAGGIAHGRHRDVYDPLDAESDSGWGSDVEPEAEESAPPSEPGKGQQRIVRVYPYGIGQNRLRAAAAGLNVPVQLVENLSQADTVVTLKNYYRQQPQPLVDAERRNIPVYILRSNTVSQMEQCLVDMFHLSQDSADGFDTAMREAQLGIQRILNGASDIELSPQSAAIRSQQHQLVRAANLISHSYGREPYRRVRIFRK